MQLQLDLPERHTQKNIIGYKMLESWRKWHNARTGNICTKIRNELLWKSSGEWEIEPSIRHRKYLSMIWVTNANENQFYIKLTTKCKHKNEHSPIYTHQHAPTNGPDVDNQHNILVMMRSVLHRETFINYEILSAGFEHMLAFTHTLCRTDHRRQIHL